MGADGRSLRATLPCLRRSSVAPPWETWRLGRTTTGALPVLPPPYPTPAQRTAPSRLRAHLVYGPAHLSDEQRKEILAAYAARLQDIAGEDPIDVGAY